MKKIFWGLFFIVAGAFVIVNQLGYYTDINLFSLLCTILIIPILIKSLFKLDFTGILFSLAFLCIIYREPLHIESLTPIPVLLTALFGSIGLSIMFGRYHFHGHHFHNHHFHDRHNKHFEQVVNGDDADEVDFNVSFGSSIKYINSEDFKVANLRSSFGSMQVYFSDAEIVGDSAVINLDVSFSGVELYIPKEWKIVNKVDVNLGAVEQKNESKEKQNKTVTIMGKVNLGGVEIFYI